MWASVISVAVSAIVMSMGRGFGTGPNNGKRNEQGERERQDQRTPSLQNLVKNFSANTNIPQMNDAALTEFSEELISKATQHNE